MSSKSYLHSPQICWLIGTGGSITDIISQNWYEQISSLNDQQKLFPFHCNLHAFDFYQFVANLKQFKTTFYNLTYILVALQNVI